MSEGIGSGITKLGPTHCSLAAVRFDRPQLAIQDNIRVVGRKAKSDGLGSGSLMDKCHRVAFMAGYRKPGEA